MTEQPNKTEKTEIMNNKVKTVDNNLTLLKNLDDMNTLAEVESYYFKQWFKDFRGRDGDADMYYAVLRDEFHDAVKDANTIEEFLKIAKKTQYWRLLKFKGFKLTRMF